MKHSLQKNSRLVYSTDQIENNDPRCDEPKSLYDCQKDTSLSKTDGIVRVRREVKGRKGKTVTTISGFPLPSEQLNRLASELKQSCGTGGSVKAGIIIIQGDHRKKIIPWLEKKGYKVKLAGG
ncbi:hypothetical protein JW835_00185 [bacterium]|nr:hypothetical protein [bacterium]